MTCPLPLLSTCLRIQARVGKLTPHFVIPLPQSFIRFGFDFYFYKVSYWSSKGESQIFSFYSRKTIWERKRNCINNLNLHTNSVFPPPRSRKPSQVKQRVSAHSHSILPVWIKVSSLLSLQIQFILSRHTVSTSTQMCQKHRDFPTCPHTSLLPKQKLAFAASATENLGAARVHSNPSVLT